MNANSSGMEPPSTLSNVDKHGIPEWGTAADGRPVKLVPDEHLQTDYEAWLAGACQHERKLIHERPNAIGSVVYVTRCTTCGMRLSQAMPHDVVADLIAQGLVTNKRDMEVFENQHSRYTGHRRELLEEIANAAAERQQPARREELADHRKTDEWKAMRKKVLLRADGICEGCLVEAAAEVHHKTYAHVGSEFAFELVALCIECHSRFHG